ncbi:MAG: hypothetical protein U0457_01775 [Candidatus Sericytochromatia bacterium]
MFGLNKFIKKVTTQNDSLNGLSNNLNEAKEKTEANLEASNEHYEEVFNEAFEYLKKFLLSEGKDKLMLKKATDGLVKATELKAGKAEPYYYLACLFHIFGENETATKYLKTVEFINPEFDGIEELKNDITNSYSLIKELKSSEDENEETLKDLSSDLNITPTQNTVKTTTVKVNRISRISLK